MTAVGRTAQIIEALMTRCTSLAVGSPPLPIVYAEPGADFDPPTDAPDGKYLDIRLFWNAPAWEGVSDGRQDQGLLQVAVVWPKNDGSIRPAEAAQLVMDHFPKALQLQSGGTRVKINNEPWLSAELVEPNRRILPVSIPWRA